MRWYGVISEQSCASCSKDDKSHQSSCDIINAAGGRGHGKTVRAQTVNVHPDRLDDGGFRGVLRLTVFVDSLFEDLCCAILTG